MRKISDFIIDCLIGLICSILFILLTLFILEVPFFKLTKDGLDYLAFYLSTPIGASMGILLSEKIITKNSKITIRNIIITFVFTVLSSLFIQIYISKIPIFLLIIPLIDPRYSKEFFSFDWIWNFFLQPVLLIIIIVIFGIIGSKLSKSEYRK